MWILPAELGPIALPDGVLLLPHHYGAEDRERLLTLLRAVVPGCAQMVLEGAALEGLVARRVEWAGGLVLVHGLGAETEVDGIRALVAPLGAKHALVQLPSAQVAGTSWMERALKVPVLRALERAWKNPEHPLRAIGIHECPLREAAQYTDEPVELLAIVTAMVEHRMAHAGVGVGKGDWGRSLDQALAERLRGRLPEEIEGPEWRSVLTQSGSARPEGAVLSELTDRGLGYGGPDGFRASPLLRGSERALVRAYVAPSISTSADDEDSLVVIERSRAAELFHVVKELWTTEVAWAVGSVMSFDIFLRSGVAGSSWGHFEEAHQILELTESQRDDVSAAITRIYVEQGRDSGSEREELVMAGAFLRGLSCTGVDARNELAEHLATLRRCSLERPWIVASISLLSNVWVLRTCIERRSVEDLRLALECLEARGDHESYGYDLKRVVDSCLRSGSAQVGHGSDRFAAIASHQPPSAADRARVESVHRDLQGEPWLPLVVGDVWGDIWCGHHYRVLQQSARVGNAIWVDLALEDLHGYLAVGIAALAVGDLDAATDRGRQVLDLATRYEIPVLRAFARELLAAVHELRGEYDVAAKLLFQSRSRYIALEDSSRILGVEQRLSRMGITFDPAGAPRRKRSPRSR